MADEIARRRELRRKKILENAEERKKKIFGTTLQNSSTTQNCEAPEQNSVPSLLTDSEPPPTLNHNNNPTICKQNDIFGANTNDLETLHTLLSNSSADRQSSSFSSPHIENNSKVTACLMSPVPLAIFVCFILYMDVPYVISNSLTLPFLLWEVHKMCFKNFKTDNTSQSLSFLGIALLMCGIQQSTITVYSQMMSLFSCLVEDFALYLFIVVSYYVTVGF